MCSIAGYLRLDRDAPDARLADAMNRAMAHRGPDATGIVLLSPGQPPHRPADVTHPHPHRVALAHNRFAIVDLSPGGAQPAASADGRVHVVFNGEIYNHPELRTELRCLGHHFTTTSDTEVLLAGYLEWGVDCFRHFNGFWAVAIYDARPDRGGLILSRDRFGEAPLFHTLRDGTFYFASEIAALEAAIGHGRLGVCPAAVTDFLLHSRCDLAGGTFRPDVRQLPPATWSAVGPTGCLNPVAYWTPPTDRTAPISVDDAADGLRHHLRRAVSIRMRADVPVGFQLSGGLDSSALLAVAADAGANVAAYTVSYPGTPHDEFPYAAEVARRYADRVTHIELRDPGENFWDHADTATLRNGEPYSGPNVFTQQLTWAAMRDAGIKVVVNGAAGDELFAGYRRDYHAPFLRSLLHAGRFGTALRESALLSEAPLARLSRANLARLLAALRPPAVRGEGLTVSTLGSAAHHIPAHLVPVRGLLAPSIEPAGDVSQRILAHLGQWRMAYWLRTANLSSLAIPVELRLPFLDHELAEFALRLPEDLLIRDGWMKYILRRAASPLLPDSITWRPRKMGFPFPYRAWCARSRGPFLRAIGDTECPYVDRPRLLAVWDELSQLNPIFLWRVMSLLMWWRRCVEGRPLLTADAPPRRAAA